MMADSLDRRITPTELTQSTWGLGCEFGNFLWKIYRNLLQPAGNF